MRIMFVCHGNICRSPMAELIFKELARKAGVLSDFTVASSATSTEEIWNGVGRPIYPQAKRELERHGIPVEDREATLLIGYDYEQYDLFACMDDSNVRDALDILGGDPKGKVKKLLSFAGSARDVYDPWYSGDFETAYNDIYRGCKAILTLILRTEAI